MPTAKVAVVTGANKGVGYHIAAQLVASRLFSTVVLACRDPDRGMAAAQAVGGDFLPLTVGDPQSATALADSIRAKYGRCDLLVNNAAIAFKGADPTPFEAQTKPTLDINFRGDGAGDGGSAAALARVKGGRAHRQCCKHGRQAPPALTRPAGGVQLAVAHHPQIARACRHI